MVDTDADLEEEDESITTSSASAGGQQPQSDQMLSLEQYLNDVISAVDPSYYINITEQHRKKMIRCLLGYNKKAEFDLRLQNLEIERQWQKTMRFVQDDLASLNPPPSVTTAPMFQEGLRLQQEGHVPFTFQRLDRRNQNKYMAPTRFFSYLARGKAYQGRFDRLLQDVAPDLLANYRDIVEESSEIELMRMLVLNDSSGRDRDDDDDISDNNDTLNDSLPAVIWKDQLLQLLEKDFGGKGPMLPECGGQWIGKNGEGELKRYLEARNREKTDDNTLIVTNVLVKTPNKHFRLTSQSNNRGKPMPHVVILSDAHLVGMTSEFDAMVLERVGDQIKVVELWEAKASLTPVTIADALFKKAGAINAVLQDLEAQIYLNPQDEQVREFLSACRSSGECDALLKNDEPIIFPLVVSHNDSTTDYDSNDSPKLGIFGMDLMSPIQGARRIQLVHCESLLEHSTDAVLEGLETGHVSAPNVRPRLESMLRAVQQLKPMLVVPSLDDR